MKTFFTTALAAFASVAVALPTTTVTATFEDLVSIPTLPELTPVGTYKGLNFENFSATNLGIQLAGIRPNSGTNVAANGVPERLGGPATLSIPAGSSTKSFDLKSFFFGCFTDLVNSAANLPASCVLNVVGTKLDGTQVAQSVSFTLSGLLTSREVKATLSNSFRGLKSVTIDPIQGAVSADLTAFFSDDYVFVLNA